MVEATATAAGGACGGARLNVSSVASAGSIETPNDWSARSWSCKSATCPSRLRRRRSVAMSSIARHGGVVAGGDAAAAGVARHGVTPAALRLGAAVAVTQGGPPPMWRKLGCCGGNGKADGGMKLPQASSAMADGCWRGATLSTGRPRQRAAGSRRSAAIAKYILAIYIYIYIYSWSSEYLAGPLNI